MLYSARNKDGGVPVEVSNEPLPYKTDTSPDAFWRYAGNPTNPRLREQRFWPKAQVETVAKEFPKEALIDWDDDEVFRVFVGQQEKAAQIDYDEERYEDDAQYRTYINKMLYEKEVAAMRIQRQFRANFDDERRGKLSEERSRRLQIEALDQGRADAKRTLDKHFYPGGSKSVSPDRPLGRTKE